jgi:hypothetical protein
MRFDGSDYQRSSVELDHCVAKIGAESVRPSPAVNDLDGATISRYKLIGNGAFVPSATDRNFGDSLRRV